MISVFAYFCHRLFLSTATSMNGWDYSFLLCRFPVKSIWISSPGVFGVSILVFLVAGNWNFKFLLAFKQAEQVFDFFSISSCMFGHQDIAASLHILFIPGCPKWFRRLGLHIVVSSVSRYDPLPL